MTAYPQKITLGDIRSTGVREVPIYCRHHRCSHHVDISADRWPDRVRLSDIEPGFVCQPITPHLCYWPPVEIRVSRPSQIG
jgi:hypothetical protein